MRSGATHLSMQIFRYMIYIWEAYEKEAESLKKGITRQKDFKYPPILPIVYYEGKQKWTVPVDFKSRIMEGEAFARYIPNFEYYLVPLRNYSSQELLDREDDISLLMLINRMQTEEDIADVLLAFLLKTNLSADEADEKLERADEKLEQAERKEQQVEAESQQIEAEKQRIETERQEIETERQQIKAEKRQMQIQLEQRNAELEELRRAYEKLLKEKS